MADKLRQFDIIYIDPSVADDTGDGLTTATAKKNLPANNEMVDGTAYIIRRRDGIICDFNTNTDLLMQTNIGVIIAGMPKAGEPLFDELPPTLQASWGTDTDDRVELYTPAINEYAYEFSNTTDQGVFWGLYNIVTRKNLSTTQSPLGNIASSFSFNASYNGTLDVQNVHFKHRDWEFDTDWTLPQTAFHTNGYLTVYYVRNVNIENCAHDTLCRTTTITPSANSSGDIYIIGAGNTNINNYTVKTTSHAENSQADSRAFYIDERYGEDANELYHGNSVFTNINIEYYYRNIANQIPPCCWMFYGAGNVLYDGFKVTSTLQNPNYTTSSNGGGWDKIFFDLGENSVSLSQGTKIFRNFDLDFGGWFYHTLVEIADQSGSDSSGYDEGLNSILIENFTMRNSTQRYMHSKALYRTNNKVEFKLQNNCEIRNVNFYDMKDVGGLYILNYTSNGDKIKYCEIGTLECIAVLYNIATLVINNHVIDGSTLDTVGISIAGCNKAIIKQVTSDDNLLSNYINTTDSNTVIENSTHELVRNSTNGHVYINNMANTVGNFLVSNGRREGRSWNVNRTGGASGSLKLESLTTTVNDIDGAIDRMEIFSRLGNGLQVTPQSIGKQIVTAYFCTKDIVESELDSALFVQVEYKKTVNTVELSQFAYNYPYGRKDDDSVWNGDTGLNTYKIEIPIEVETLDPVSIYIDFSYTPTTGYFYLDPQVTVTDGSLLPVPTTVAPVMASCGTSNGDPTLFTTLSWTDDDVTKSWLGCTWTNGETKEVYASDYATSVNQNSWINDYSNNNNVKFERYFQSSLTGIVDISVNGLNKHAEGQGTITTSSGSLGITFVDADLPTVNSIQINLIMPKSYTDASGITYAWAEGNNW